MYCTAQSMCDDHIVPFTETPPYAAHVERINAQIVGLTAQRAPLDRSGLRNRYLPARTADEDRLFTNLGSQLRTLRRRLETTTELSQYSMVELIELWEASHGRRWTAEERALLDESLVAFEGRGEKPLRHRLGLPQVVSRDSCDLPGDEEVKHIGDNPACSFRLGKVGRRVYVRLLRLVADEDVTDDMLDGNVSPSKIYRTYPEHVRRLMCDSLMPSRVLSCYSAIYLTTETGFSRVPRDHYDVAFGLICVAQHTPQYRLRREYVEGRLAATLKDSLGVSI